MDILAYNREAWDGLVAKQDRWTVPVNAEAIAKARRGEWEIVLTPQKPVPRAWFPDLKGLDVLCLASGGGQQAPILAAAGATVTVLDNSPRQLEQDRAVAARDGLEITTLLGDMRDLSRFVPESFDLVVNPVSTCFVDDVRRVFWEVSRVLRRGGSLLGGYANPIAFALDPVLEDQGTLTITRRIPWSDVKSANEADQKRLRERGEPLSFGHSLEDLIGGQIAAGLLITGYYDDEHLPGDKLSEYLSPFFATRAIKP